MTVAGSASLGSDVSASVRDSGRPDWDGLCCLLLSSDWMPCMRCWRVRISSRSRPGGGGASVHVGSLGGPVSGGSVGRCYGSITSATDLSASGAGRGVPRRTSPSDPYLQEGGRQANSGVLARLSPQRVDRWIFRFFASDHWSGSKCRDAAGCVALVPGSRHHWTRLPPPWRPARPDRCDRIEARAWHPGRQPCRRRAHVPRRFQWSSRKYSLSPRRSASGIVFQSAQDTE